MSFQAGIFYFDARPVPPPEADAIRHWVHCPDYGPPRGRRDEGVFLAEASPHGFRRTQGDHPAGGAVTFDGRLDNRSELLVRLRGAVAADAGDAAIAAAAYHAWGVDGLAFLIGDWSLAIWDAARKTVVLASDFAGARPLYYSVQGDRAAWSTRLAPLAGETAAGDLDDTYVAGLLGFGGCPNRTLYRGIRPVPAGHAVLLSSGGTRTRQFWKLPVGETVRYHREADYEEHLRWLFREAVRCRVPSDAACLCELSGGYDSSSVVAMAAELAAAGESRPTGLATVSFEHEGSLDRPFYQAMERHCRLPGTHLSTTEYPFLREVDAGGAVPAFWGALWTQVAALAREQGATTYLTGQFGDLIMGNWRDDSEQVAGLLRQARIASALGQAFAWSKTLRVPVAWILGRALLASLPPWLGSARWYGRGNWSEAPEEREDSIAPVLRRRFGDEQDSSFSRKWTRARPERRKHFRGVMEWIALRGFQPPEALEHLAYVHPFAHRPLVSFMLSIPAEVVCRPGEPRRLMRRAFHQLWPTELRRRRSKDGFRGVFLESLRPIARALLAADRPFQVVERGWVDQASFERRLERLVRSASCNEGQLRQIILLELWLRRREDRTLRTAMACPA